MLRTIIIYLNQFSQQNYFKIPKVSEYSPKFPIFPQNSQYSWWKFTALKIPGNFASLHESLRFQSSTLSSICGLTIFSFLRIEVCKNYHENLKDFKRPLCFGQRRVILNFCCIFIFMRQDFTELRNDPQPEA